MLRFEWTFFTYAQVLCLFIRKLATQARENGIIGLMAYTSPQNKAMVALFKTLPYKVKTSFDGDSLMLAYRFELSERLRIPSLKPQSSTERRAPGASGTAG